MEGRKFELSLKLNTYRKRTNMSHTHSDLLTFFHLPGVDLLLDNDGRVVVAVARALRRRGALRPPHGARPLGLRGGRFRLRRVSQADVHLVVLHLGLEPVALVEQLAQSLDAEGAELELLLVLVAVQRLQPVPVDQVGILRLRRKVRLRRGVRRCEV